MILFKVSLSLYLICYPFSLILDLFYLSVKINTTLTTLSCKIEAKVNLSSVCQRCCTKEKVPEEEEPANPCWFIVWVIQARNMRVWSYGCSLGVPAGILPSLFLQIQYFLESAKLTLTFPSIMCYFTHFDIFKYLCACFRLSTVTGRSPCKYLLGYSYFFSKPL